MFSYYGSKSKIIHHYPSPLYKTIIEPFAGSGRYCLRYFEQDCWLNDKYKTITDIWKWMIAATEEDISSLPDLKNGDDIREILCEQVIKDLLGFSVALGVQNPHNIVTKWAGPRTDPNGYKRDGRVPQQKRILLKYCGKLTHWKITNQDFKSLPDIEATWFIDPPYVKGGKHYIENVIDYSELAAWCKSRRGQVIVCENNGADWLPFRPLVKSMGSKNRYSQEMIWTSK